MQVSVWSSIHTRFDAPLGQDASLSQGYAQQYTARTHEMKKWKTNHVKKDTVE